MNYKYKILVIALINACFVNHAYAAAVIPNTVQPGRIEKDLNKLPSLPAPSETITVPSSEPQQMPAEAASIKFVLKEIQLSGNTAFSTGQLASYWKDMLGKEILLADVFELAKKLTVKYRESGYILSQVIVPVQDIQNGIVKLKVIEGFINTTEIKGGDKNLQDKLLTYLEPIKLEKPLTGKTLERYLLLLNDLGGVRASGYLQASKEPNATDLIVTIAQDKFSGSVGAHNRISKLIGNVQFDGSLNFNNIFGLLEKNNLRTLASDTGDLFYINYVGEFPLGSNGLAFSPSISYSKNQPDIGGGVDIKSTSNAASFMFSYPVLRGREQNLFIRSGLSLFNSETEFNGLTTDKYKLRTLRLGATYDNVDRYRGVNQVDIELSKGIDGLGAQDDNVANNNGNNTSFTKTTLYLARLQSISPRWTILAALNGQYSKDILLSAERFGLGGESFLRGFDSSELLGDSGIAGKLELRYNSSLGSTPITAYTLYESGKVWIRNNQTPNTVDSASSIGLGLRFTVFSQWNGYLEIDKPLGRDVGTENNRNARVFANLTYSF